MIPRVSLAVLTLACLGHAPGVVPCEVRTVGAQEKTPKAEMPAPPTPSVAFTIDIPAEVKASGDYVTFVPRTDAKAITYVALSGVEPFPSELLKDARAFVLPVRGLPAGRYRFKAVGSLNDVHAATAFSVLVGESPPDPGPSPGPSPGPAPGPAPSPTPPAPAPVTSFRVLFIVERMANLTPGQNAVVHGAEVERFLDARTTKTDGTRGWRRVDPHAGTAGDTPTMNALWASVKPSVTAVPCVAVEVNGKVEIVPLEETPAKMVAKFKSYLGEK